MVAERKKSVPRLRDVFFCHTANAAADCTASTKEKEEKA